MKFIAKGKCKAIRQTGQCIRNGKKLPELKAILKFNTLCELMVKYKSFLWEDVNIEPITLGKLENGLKLEEAGSRGEGKMCIDTLPRYSQMFVSHLKYYTSHNLYNKFLI